MAEVLEKKYTMNARGNSILSHLTFKPCRYSELDNLTVSV